MYGLAAPFAPELLGECELEFDRGLKDRIRDPTRTFDYSDYGTIYDMEAEGDYLYIAFGAGQVRTVDISDPASPRETGTLSPGGFVVALTAEDSLLYVDREDEETGKMGSLSSMSRTRKTPAWSVRQSPRRISSTVESLSRTALSALTCPAAASGVPACRSWRCSHSKQKRRETPNERASCRPPPMKDEF